MRLKTELRRLNDEPLEALESFLAQAPRSLTNQLIILMSDDDPKIQIRATWLLKRLAESKARFSRDQLMAMFDSVIQLNHWEARLHLCQMLQHIKIPKLGAPKVVWFLERCLSERNKFLRAWAYSGFYELARQHSEFRDYARKQLDRGEGEKSAAVKARLRIIRSQLEKLE